MEHHLNHCKMKIWVTAYDKDGNAFIKPIISVPWNILLDLSSHFEETTQEDFSTYIYEIYKPNKRKDKSMLKTCISSQRKKRTENWKLILTNSETKLQVMKVLKETSQSRPAKKLIEGLTIPANGYFYQQFSKWKSMHLCRESPNSLSTKSDVCYFINNSVLLYK